MNSGRIKKGHIPWNKNPISKICVNCSKIFFISRSRHISGRGKFCSLNCRRTYKYKLARQFKINSSLAELIGVIIGDGCISKVKGRNDYRIQISGNRIEDKDYMEEYLPELVLKCLNIKTKPYLAKNGAYVLQFQSEPFRIFLKSLDIFSPKSKIIRIPRILKENKSHLCACIRGIADTDFTLIFTKRGKNLPHNYPRISAQFASEKLVLDLEESLRSMGFTLNTKYNYHRSDKRGFSCIGSVEMLYK